MLFELEKEAVDEIDNLKLKYNFNAEQVFILKIVKFLEIAKLGYNELKDNFIEIQSKAEHLKEILIRKNNSSSSTNIEKPN